MAGLQHDGAIEIWLESFTDQVLTVAATAEAENLTGSTAPRRLVIRSPGRERLYRLAMPVQGRWRYRWNYSYHPGSDSATHDDNAIYALPYGSGESYPVLQGYDGSFSHTGRDRYALDWAMPEGTEVHAARAGVVIGLREDSRSGGPSEDHKGEGNFLWLRHDDGTLGWYVHFEEDGVLVEVGDRVAAGDVIGRSGNTGFSSEPHLHFHVSTVARGRDAYRTIPVRFRLADGRLATLKEGRRYTAP